MLEGGVCIYSTPGVLNNFPILSGQSVKLQITGRQLKFRPNHRRVSCNFPVII